MVFYSLSDYGGNIKHIEHRGKERQIKIKRYLQKYKLYKSERPTIKSQVDFEKKLKNFRNKKLHDNKACTSANQNQ